ncbi:MAG TPA: exosortase/archaeosortase family protein [Pirellulales bacterium]|nr:exosortase/archaeosortase family protein [Pirellulales bacterium]
MDRAPKPITLPIEWNWRSYSVAALLIAAFVWSYWPVLGHLVTAWETVPDYSHGYFVVPVAGYLLWSRRASMPGRAAGFAWGGLLLLLFSVAVRTAGSLCYIDAIEGWSLPLWVAGAIWMLAGRRMLWWATPAVVFLGFMIPLPFRAETLLSSPLQNIASRLSCWFLQTLGEPAIREGNVVLLGDVRLNVVEACSGLRIFISICALAFVYDALVNKPWWTRCALVAAVAPVAVLANALRITLTGLLHVKVSGEAAHRFSHDFAGWLMLPVAAVLLAGWLWYVGRLIVERQTVSATDLLHRSMPPSAA